ncbi:sulfatase [Zhouia amylolytica]|nr:sulfatase [Zhouia amylolytica]
MTKVNIKQPSLLVAIMITFAFLSSCAKEHKQVDPPNIIVFLVDDMGLMDSSVPFLTDTNGTPVRYPLNEYYRTPNMETLAKQGIRFSNFYAHSVCSPTRASIMTGQTSARHRVTNWVNAENNNRTKFGPSQWNWEGLNKSSVTLPRVLQQNGYRTIHVGKAHFGPIGFEGEDPTNLGFDVNIGGSSIGHPGSYYGKDGFGHIKGNKSRAVPGLEKYHGKDIFLTEALTLEANAMITQAKEDNKPFFLYMSHYAVHAPFHSDPRFAAHYEDSGKSPQAQAYATLVEGIDKSLGDIITHVKSLGLGENTLILFMGDNGSDAPLPIVEDYSSSEPLKGKKGNHWEGGMRVPFIASWVSPDENADSQEKLAIPAGGIQNQMGTVIDLFPSLCDITGIDLPEKHTLDGFTLRSQLEGNHNKTRNELFLNHFPHGVHRSDYFTSLVNGHWKVVYHYPVKENPRYELFNLKDDPFETTNLANAEPEQLKLMIATLKEQLQNTQALYPEKDSITLKLTMP